MKQEETLLLLLLAIAIGMVVLFFRWLFRKADAANVADWGGKWKNRVDGLNRLFLRNYHKCHIDPVPLPEEGPALVVANHISGLDPMMMIAACQRPVQVQGRVRVDGHEGLAQEVLRVELVAPEHRHAVDEVRRRRDAHEWRERLAQLSTRQRDAIVLRHVVGLTYDEIGEVLDRPAGTIKSDVHRGLDRLRDMITTEELR